MIIGLPLRCRYWSVLQVVVIVVCYRGKVSSAEKVQGCAGSQISLRCPETKIIKITAVVLGDSACHGASCCITDSDCTYNANGNHITDVHRTCDNKESCTVGVLREKIPCGLWGMWYISDFERITYVCEDDPPSIWWDAATFSRPYSTEDITLQTEESTPEKEPENVHLTSTYETLMIVYNNEKAPDDGNTGPTTDEPNSKAIPVVMVIICIIVLLAVVTPCLICWRKKRRQVTSSDAIKKSDLENYKKEAIYANDVQRTSVNVNSTSSIPIYSEISSTDVEESLNHGVRNLETRTSDYCQLDGVATGRIKHDSQYEQLDHGRNYEPLTVYEPLQ